MVSHKNKREPEAFAQTLQSSLLSKDLDLSNGNNGNGLLRHELACAEAKEKRHKISPVSLVL